MVSKQENIAFLMRGAWAKRWWLLGVQVLAAAAAIAVFHIIPPKYQSETTIRFEPESVLNPLTQGLAVSSGMESIIGTMRQQLLSRQYIEDVMAYLGMTVPGADPVEQERRVHELASNISVEVTTPPRRSTGASLFHVSYLGDDPQKTREVTNALALIFIEKTQATKSGESEAAYEFINEQLEVYRQRLEESDDALRTFEEKHIDELPDSRSSSITRLETLRATLRDVQHRISQTRIQKDLLIQRLPREAAESTEGSDLVANPLIATLQEKEEELQALKRRYSDNYPDVISLKAEVDMLRLEIEKNPSVPASDARRTGPSAVAETILNQLQQVDVEIESLTSRVPKIEKEIASLERKVRGIPRSEQELVRLQRDYDVNSSIYEMFLRRLEEARVSRELEQAKKAEVLKVVEEANLPRVPYFPQRKQFFLIGLGAGLALNGALLFWLFSSNTSFRSVSEAEEYLELTVLARIPREALGVTRGVVWRKALSFGGALVMYAVLYVGAFYWDKVLDLLKAGI